jgi:hypothetical protein
MVNINTEPLRELSGQTTSLARVAIGIIAGLGFLVGGTILFAVIHLLAVWLIICVLTIVSLIAYAFVASERSIKKGIRLFAETNNFSSLSREEMVKLLPPSLQDNGINQKYKNGYEGNVVGTKLYLFDYSYDISSTSRKGSKSYGIAALITEKPYAHMYLDGKGNYKNNTYKSQQKISLEGNFDKYFDLYALDEGNIEALSFLTPDVMEIFINTANLFDVEVKDNVIFLITTDTGVYYKANMDRLLTCIDALSHKITKPSPTSLGSETALVANSPGLIKKNHTLANALATFAAFVVIIVVLILQLKQK